MATNKGDAFDWQAFVFSPEEKWMDRLSELAQRRFPRVARAEAAHNFALERLSADGWALLRAYDGTSNPGTYLTIIFKRLLEDYSRVVDGRARPPAWLSRAGDLWVRIHRMLCLERFDAQSVIDRFTAAGDRTEERLRAIIREIKRRIPTCGQVQGEAATLSVEQETLESFDGAGDLILGLADEEDRSVLQCLAALLCADGISHDPSIEMSTDALAQRFSASLAARAADDFGLTGEERLILRLHFQEDLKLARIGRSIQMPEHTVRRTLRRALKKLAKGLREAGMPVIA